MIDLVARLQAALGERVHVDAETRARHRRDTWVLGELEDLEQRPAALPLAVVEPATGEEVVAAVRLCREARAPLVPFGGGSGVCGAVRVPKDAVVLSTRQLTGLVELDGDDLLASFRAGTNGLDAEERLQRDGLTIGHWPQSIALSTVGGWVATRAAGQFSTAYGSIEDVLMDLEAVLPDGSLVRTRRTPRASAGPDLRQIFLGSEGTLGVITRVGFSLRPLPEASRPQAFTFPSLQAGLDPIRRVLRAGWRPPVVRLYDAAESNRQFQSWCPEGRALLLLLHEGPETLVDAQLAGVAGLCEAAGGEAADPAAMQQWLAHRNQFPGFRGFLEKGIILDTIEVACTWKRTAELYEQTVAALLEVPGVRAATAHSSHSYRSGTCLYFTFVARPEERSEMESVYRECWRRVMATAVRLGAGISHHHGIGRVRRDVLPEEIGAGGVTMLRALKRSLDPDGLFNPGALLPPEPA